MKIQYLLVLFAVALLSAGYYYSRSTFDDGGVPSATSTSDAQVSGEPKTSPPSATSPAGTGESSAQTVPKDVQKKLTGARPKEFVNISGYINTDRVVQKPNTNVLLLNDYIGKQVILIEFWTYASLPSLRDIPYLSRWWNTYKDKGLLIVAIHSPELAFERDQSNVAKAVTREGITYPVLLDSFLGTWNAYGTKNWPRRILVGIDGTIVSDQAGGGNYEEMEKKIQELLITRATKLSLSREGISVSITTPFGATAPTRSRVKELNLGASKNQGSLGNAFSGKEGILDIAPTNPIEDDKVYFAGSWSFLREYVENRTQGTVAIRYGSGRVSGVLGNEKTIRIKVTLDGAPLGERAGKDVVVEKGESILYVTEERLYEIVDDPAGYGEHTLQFTADENGLLLYRFIFG